MNGPILTLLAVIVAGLLLLGGLGAVSRHQARRAIGSGATGLSGLATGLLLTALLTGEEPVRLLLRIGVPGVEFGVLLDPLSGFFALLVFATGTATIAYAARTDAARSLTRFAAMPIAVAGFALAALSADTLAFATGLALAGGAIWATGRSDRFALGNSSLLLVTLLGAAAVVGISALPSTKTILFGPATAVSPAWAAAAWVILLIGFAPLVGLVPLQISIARQEPPVPTHCMALMVGAGMPLAIYPLIRLMASLPAHPLPAWSGLPPLILGVAAVLIGGVQATREETLDAALAASAVRQSGVAAIGLAFALTARALDLPQAAALAMAAVLLAAATQAVCGTLSVLCGGAVHRGAATRHLSRLGGLIHRMPACTACLIVALAGLAALPPGPGFATFWLLLQAMPGEILAAGRTFQAAFIVAAGALALAAALAVAGLVRLVGVVCLGRPRTPRTAAADALPRPTVLSLLCLAGVSAGLGTFVGPALRLLADPAIREVLGAGLGERAGLMGVAPLPGGRGYPALPLTLLLVLGWGIAEWLRRRMMPANGRVGPAWEEGFAAPPPWLPFGDPLTQTSGIGFIPDPEDRCWPRRMMRPPASYRAGASALAVTILAVVLALLGWLAR